MEREIVQVDNCFEPLMPKFMANRHAELALLHEALAQQDFQTLRRVSHKMKGVGGTFGFDPITEIASAIEFAAKAEDASTIERELPRLVAYMERIDIVFI